MRYICRKVMSFSGTLYDIGELIAEGDLVADRIPQLLRIGVIAMAGESIPVPVPVPSPDQPDQIPPSDSSETPKDQEPVTTPVADNDESGGEQDVQEFEGAQADHQREDESSDGSEQPAANGKRNARKQGS